VRRFAIDSTMRRTAFWLSVNACGALFALFACGPTPPPDDGNAAPIDAPTRPILPQDGDIDAAASASVLISEVRSRGVGGAADEFIELYNPSDTDVTLDASWTVDGRSDTSKAYSARWVGTGLPIPAHGHFLLTGTAYVQQPDGDAPLMNGITDASALRLSHAGMVVDTLCYAADADTLMVFMNDASYGCEGTPVMNVHDNSTATDSDQSLERKPGGGAGNGQDTNDNATDFAALMPSDPQSSVSDITR
jgi:hypothetical protein